MSFRIRDLKDSEIETAALLLSKNWNYEHIASSKACRLQALYDFYQCLGRSDIRLVAEMDGRIAGILLGSTGEIKNKEDLKKAAKAALDLVFEPRGIALNTYNRDYARRSELLFKDTDKPELVLLMVDGKRNGTGRKLVAAYEERLKEKGLDDYVVLSDTKCDYDFYPHMGFEKIAEDIGEDPIEDKKLSLFLYEKNLV